MVGVQLYVIAHNIQEERHDRCQKYEINVTVVNSQKMKCELKGLVNMNMQGGGIVNFIKVLYITQAIKNFFRV